MWATVCLLAQSELMTCCHKIPFSKWVTVLCLLAQFELLTCWHEIPSSKWSHCVPPSSIWIADMLAWNPIQDVSQCVPLAQFVELLTSHPVCESLSWCLIAQFELLTCCHEIPSRLWVTVCLLAQFELLTCCHDIPFSEWVTVCLPGLAQFELLECCHEIPSRMWVTVCLLVA